MTLDPDAHSSAEETGHGPGGRPTQIILARIILPALLAAANLAFDLMLPLGVTGGVPYVALVLLGFFFIAQERRFRPGHRRIRVDRVRVLFIAGRRHPLGGADQPGAGAVRDLSDGVSWLFASWEPGTA